LRNFVEKSAGERAAIWAKMTEDASNA